MNKADLLADFTSKVDQFEKYHGFIEKTNQQADKFAKSVVEKVIRDNTAKRDDVVAELIPLTVDIDRVIGDLEAQKQSVLDGQQEHKLALEEMELRQAIGELDDKAFEKQSAELKGALDSSNKEIDGIDDELKKFIDEMERWRAIGNDAGVLSQHPAEPDDDYVEIESVDILGPDSDLADLADLADDVDVSAFQEDADDDGVRFEQVNQVDDVSVVFEDDDEGAEIKLEVGDMDTLLDDALEAVDEESEDRPRRAVMLYQEGTAEEQIHPFTGDVLTLGRGRDNDIQVKNDSKVSRYHCKLYRRNGNFYIEDNKSANGTLVNGELITERRLFGGEEIIIGETFFRFRIMD